MSTPTIQWYPGHIAKAEQQLKRHLDKVDLVIEVRDARIPLATGHPHLNRWLKGKQHLLVINRRDMVTAAAKEARAAWFKAQGQRTVWCDAKAGTGVKQVQQAIYQSAVLVARRRMHRQPRRLVEHDQMVVLKQHIQIHRLRLEVRQWFRRRHPQLHLVPLAQGCFGLAGLAVDAHIASVDELLNPGPALLGALTHQPAV